MAGVMLATLVAASSEGGAPNLGGVVPATAAERAVLAIHRFNEIEIIAGELAIRKGSRARIRRFGALLARDHRYADRHLLGLARRQGLRVYPVEYSPAEREDRARLERSVGAAFDREFIAAMRRGHLDAIAVLEQVQRRNTSEPKLRDFILTLLPVVHHHAELASRSRI